MSSLRGKLELLSEGEDHFELLSEGEDHFSLFYAHYTMSSIVLRRAGLGWDF